MRIGADAGPPLPPMVDAPAPRRLPDSPPGGAHLCARCGALHHPSVQWFPESRVLIAGPKAIILSRLHARVFDGLWTALEADEKPTIWYLVDAAFGGLGKANSAPALLRMQNTRTAVFRVRRKILPLGLDIKTRSGPGATYRLQLPDHEIEVAA
jgi:hypothetical protein